MKNQIGLHMGYWWGTEASDDLNRILELTAQAELEILEVNPACLLRMTPEACQKLLRRAKDCGVRFTLNGGLDATNDIASGDEAARRKGIEYCIRVLERMSELEMTLWSGVNYSAWLRAPQPEGDAQEEKVRACGYAVQRLQPILRAAEREGIDYCFEVVNRFEQFLFNTAQEAVAFAEAVGSPRAKVHLDTYHMNIEEDNTCAAICFAGVSGRLGHFHAGESNRRVPGVGAANLDWRAIGRALRQAGYAGAVVMEPFVLTTAFNAKRTRVWRDLSHGATLQQLVCDAQTGGRFLRGILEE